jgi:hypothetical protein
MSETGEWIEHNGATVPARDGYKAEPKFRGGQYARHSTWRGWLWSKFAPSKHDVVAYRWVKP